MAQNGLKKPKTMGTNPQALRGFGGSGTDAQPTGPTRRQAGLATGQSSRVGSLAAQIKSGAGLGASHGNAKVAPNAQPEKVKRAPSSIPTGGVRGSAPTGTGPKVKPNRLKGATKSSPRGRGTI